MTEFKDFSLQHAISNIEDQLQGGDDFDDRHDDIMPQAAQDMGSGIVFLRVTHKVCLQKEKFPMEYKLL